MILCEDAWVSPRTINHEDIREVVVGVTCSRQASKAPVRWEREVENGEAAV